MQNHDIMHFMIITLNRVVVQLSGDQISAAKASNLVSVVNSKAGSLSLQVKNVAAGTCHGIMIFHRNVSLIPRPNLCEERVLGHWSDFLVVRNITGYYTKLSLSLQNQEPAPISPDHFLTEVGSGNETIYTKRLRYK